jgi:hypothetical protein
MIDLNQLTQEQRWGLQFVVMQENAFGGRDEPWTEESYLKNVICSACDSYYQQLLEHKQKVTIETFYSLSVERQSSILSQLGVQDILGQQP